MKISAFTLIATSLLLASTACAQISPPIPAAAPPPAALQAQNDLLSSLMGDPPNFAASSNGSLLAMVSGPHGRGAKAGALVELYFKDLGEEHLWDAYSGLSYDGHFAWLHDLKLTEQRLDPGNDVVTSRFTTPDGQLAVETQDLVLRDRDVLVRRLSVRNQGQTPIQQLSPFFYENLTVNFFPTGDHCAYLADAGAIDHYENQVHFAIGLDQAPAQFQCGGVKNYLTRAQDAMNDAQDGVLHSNGKADAYAGLGVNGALAAAPVALEPGQSLQQLSFIAAGTSREEALSNLQAARQQSWEEMVQQKQQAYQHLLQSSTLPSGLSTDEQEVYQRALIVIKQHSTRSGAHIAGPTTLNTTYRFSWPRDGSYIALTDLLTGHPENSRRFLDFMAAGQKANGGWAINYQTNGQPFLDFGDRGNEYDEVGTVPWMMVEYARRTGDWNWLQTQWPGIQKACEFLLRNTNAQTGLMEATRDLWELSTSDSWTYSNAAAYAGFKAGAEAARRVGDSASSERYEQAATQLKAAIVKYLWNADKGYFVRGFNLGSQRQDLKVEAANLALAWPFKVFAPDDPRMVSMANHILSDLASPQGGIRRYTGDDYYGGQPWPVTTDWLAIYLTQIGRLDEARRLHQTVTHYAMSSLSRQLGEQFDEQQGRWVSALPLTWSEAEYILATQALAGLFNPDAPTAGL